MPNMEERISRESGKQMQRIYDSSKISNAE